MNRGDSETLRRGEVLQGHREPVRDGVRRRVAILATCADWANTHGLSRDLTLAGLDVIIIGPEDSLALLTRFNAGRVKVAPGGFGGGEAAFFNTIVKVFAPEQFLAADDPSFGRLAVVAALGEAGGLSPEAAIAVSRSVPGPAACEVLISESRLLAAAGDLGCHAPAFLENPDTAAAAAFAAAQGYPVAVKIDGLWAGAGITRCDDQPALEAALAAAEGRSHVVQRFITGSASSVVVAGLGGRAIGAFAYAKAAPTRNPYGPATLARAIDRPDLLRTAVSLFERFGLNGFAGVDFIIDEAGEAFLLEVNPRITPMSHLGRVFGTDLVSAWIAAMEGRPPPPSGPRLNDHVALFPGELLRDPASPWLKTAWHDVPWDDPDIIARLMPRAAKTGSPAQG
jgi:hypothetical protein